MRSQRLTRGARIGAGGKDGGDSDQPPVKAVLVLDFDISAPFPEKHNGQRFGPRLIERSLQAGSYVMAELIGITGQFPVSSARWEFDALEVLIINGWRLPERLFTLKTLQGFKL